MEQDPVPPYEPVQREGEAAFATSALQMSLVEPVNAGPAQQLVLLRFPLT